eukprot:TRINITY_DN12622_c1_g1_i1.p1 TRINITY_DN12622_c1_g1~~TRINITY_DN12622_c1_g1_i1.p1  ORF type:complete len:315 (+),score=81.78 TRINITY_DN12622_c1_g1_i1:51-995(+)
MVNPGLDLDVGWVLSAKVNKPAILARAAQIPTRRSIKSKWQVAFYLRTVQCIDLTTLAGDDTPCNVKRLCAKAARPVHHETLKMLGLEGHKITTGAVCVYPNCVADAVAALKGTGIPVASVATGFPAGQTPLKLRLEEIKMAVADGAQEIDIVIPRRKAILGDWQGLYDEIKAMKAACGSAHMKTILATGELPTLTHVYKCSLVAMMAGSDFIKTSTGKEPTNATIPVGIVMTRAIRAYYERTGVKVGFKPAGGIRSAKQALQWFALMMEELGEEWTQNDLFRIGASSLLGDVERQLYHSATGRYHGASYIPMA